MHPLAGTYAELATPEVESIPSLMKFSVYAGVGQDRELPGSAAAVTYWAGLLEGFRGRLVSRRLQFWPRGESRASLRRCRRTLPATWAKVGALPEQRGNRPPFVFRWAGLQSSCTSTLEAVVRRGVRSFCQLGVGERRRFQSNRETLEFDLGHVLTICRSHS